MALWNPNYNILVELEKGKEGAVREKVRLEIQLLKEGNVALKERVAAWVLK